MVAVEHERKLTPEEIEEQKDTTPRGKRIDAYKESTARYYAERSIQGPHAVRDRREAGRLVASCKDWLDALTIAHLMSIQFFDKECKYLEQLAAAERTKRNETEQPE